MANKSACPSLGDEKYFRIQGRDLCFKLVAEENEILSIL